MWHIFIKIKKKLIAKCDHSSFNSVTALLHLFLVGVI